MMKRTCSIEDCERLAHCRGWCQKHYVRWLKYGDPLSVHKTGYKARPALERLLSHVEVDPITGCWLWRGQQASPSGYIYFAGDDGEHVLIHRWSHLHFNGPIPDGWEVDHLCHTNDPDCPGGPTCLHRRCCCPDHLEAVTRLVNAQRGVPAKKTHCIHGHEFTPDNTILSREGWRSCRTCKIAAMRKWWGHNRAKTRDDRAV